MLSSKVPDTKSRIGAQNPVLTNSTAFATGVRTAHGMVSRPTDAEIFQATELSQLIDIDSPDQLAFHQALKQLSEPFIQLVCKVIESPDNWQKFVSCPSSVRGHHSEAGGNLRHTIEVAQSCAGMASGYTNLVDHDVLITAALLHDFGKIHCYRVGSVFPWQHTDQSRLLGHKLLGVSPVIFHIQRSCGFTDAQALGLMHCLAASSVKTFDSRGPACLEAEILMKADQLSAAADLYRLSSEAKLSRGGFGVRHPHQRQVPFHIKGNQQAPAERPTRFGEVAPEKRTP